MGLERVRLDLRDRDGRTYLAERLGMDQQTIAVSEHEGNPDIY